MDIESRIDSLPTKLGEAMRHVEPRPKNSLDKCVVLRRDLAPCREAVPAP